jgi:hypothetical protein
LCSRIRPTSVRPNTCTTTSPLGEGDGFDPAASGTLTRSVSFTSLEAFVELFPPSRSEILALDSTHERASLRRAAVSIVALASTNWTAAASEARVTLFFSIDT